MLKKFGITASVFIALLPTKSYAVPELAPVVIQDVDINPPLIEDNATEIARFLNSREIISTQVSKVLDVTLPQSMMAVTDFAIYEKEYPGLIAAISASIKPAMLKAYDDKMPLLWSKQSQVIRDNLTSTDIDKLLIFYRSPAGIRLITAIRNNADVSSIVNAAVVSGGPDESVKTALQKETMNAIRKSAAQTSAADKLEIFRFENSPLGRKLPALIPLQQRATLEWDFYFTEEQKNEIAKVRQDAISDFIAKADAAKAALKQQK